MSIIEITVLTNYLLENERKMFIKLLSSLQHFAKYHDNVDALIGKEGEREKNELRF